MNNAIAFRSPLRLEHLGGAEWKLLGDYLVVVGPMLIRVPIGFQTDLASVPRVFRSLIPVVGNQNGPAVVHDWLYVHRRIDGRALGRAEADRIFRDLLSAAGVGWTRRTMMYVAVRLGGWAYWSRAAGMR